MATYPSGLFSWVTKIDNVDAVMAAHPNSLAAEIVALQTKLGVDSSSDSSSIDYFLTHASGEFRTHKHDGSSDDGAATIGPLTGITVANNVDVGDYQVRMKQLYTDVPTGTAPLVIDSTTVVSNLNADQVDGLDSTDIVQTTGNQTVAGIKTFSSFPITPSSSPSTNYQVANKAYVDTKELNSYVGQLSVASTGNVSVTGVGFQPKAVIFICGYNADASRKGSVISIWDGTIMYYAGHAPKAGDASGTSRAGSNFSCIAETTVEVGFSGVSLDSDGFTVNITTANSGYRCYYIVLK